MTALITAVGWLQAYEGKGKVKEIPVDITLTKRGEGEWRISSVKRADTGERL